MPDDNSKWENTVTGPNGGQGARGPGIIGLKVSCTTLGEKPTRVELLDEGQGGGAVNINFILRIDSIGVTLPCLTEFLF